MNSKAFIWHGFIDAKCNVKVIPSREGNSLVNLCVVNKDGFWDVRCDDLFIVKISKNGKGLVTVSAHECEKFWFSSMEDALDSVQGIDFVQFPFYVHKYADNCFTVDSYRKSLDCVLVETVVKPA